MYRDQDQRDFAWRLRNEPTAAKKLLWCFLRGGKLGAKFRRQAAIDVDFVDFVCFARQLVVELERPQLLWTRQQKKSMLDASHGGSRADYV